MYTSGQKSLIVSILSAGTFFGALFAGQLADYLGRRNTIVTGCAVFSAGVALQVASTTISLLVSGRLIAGIGVGSVSAVIILYMSEIAPKNVRGAIVSAYQFFITVGLLLAAVVDQATHSRLDSSSYRIPMALQWLWALILGVGLLFLPESPTLLGQARALRQGSSRPEYATRTASHLSIRQGRAGRAHRKLSPRARSHADELAGTVFAVAGRHQEICAE